MRWCRRRGDTGRWRDDDREKVAWTISRILCPLYKGGDHFSGPAVADRLKQPTRSSDEPGRFSLLIWPCTRWGLPCLDCRQPSGALLPHHFTLTCQAASGLTSAVCFLWRCPAQGSRLPRGWALPTTVPCRVRTFLGLPMESRDHLVHATGSIVSRPGSCGQNTVGGRPRMWYLCSNDETG